MQLIDDALDPVMPAVGPFPADPDASGIKADVVEDDKDMFGRDLVKSGGLSDGVPDLFIIVCGFIIRTCFPLMTASPHRAWNFERVILQSNF